MDMPKPSDFFLSIVAFLGVLLPGAALVFLYGGTVQSALALPRRVDSQWRWVVPPVAAYIVGPVLLTISQLLNPLAEWLYGLIHREFPKQIRREREAYKSCNGLACNTGNSFVFHEALCRVRVQHPAAAAEVDQHMADYKLLRNLVLVFLIDFIASLAPPANSFRAKIAVLCALAALLTFACLYSWAELLAFQYARLLREQKTETAYKQPSSSSTV